MNSTTLFGIGLLLGLGFAGTRARAQTNMGFPVHTTVAQGTLEGRYSTQTGVQTYFGIPFAAPPVGDLRWRPPQAPDSWEGVRQATEFGPRPIQPYVYDDMRFRSPMASEDCLYLNVWTPARKDQDKLPVLVYFHGGGNTTGSGDELRYDGEKLAEDGIVVVTPNYRLGVFGFLSHPELTEEQGGHSGNYGILDQVAALEWVRDNIAAFGGDPERITIAGESAGSIDVSVLMTSPLSRGLIAGAVGQSGAAIDPTFAPITQQLAETNGLILQNQTDYEGIAGLRGASTRELYEAAITNPSYRFPGGLVLDDFVLPATPAEILAAGEQAAVPLMVGWTSAEMGWLNPPESADKLVEQIRAEFGDMGDSLALAYGVETNPNQAMVDLYSDSWIVFSTWKWADLHATTSDEPVYRYRFNRVRPPLQGQTRDREPMGAGHASDIEYFMNTLAKSDAYAWENDDRTTAGTMSAYLVNFVKTGDPNGGGLPEWNPLEQGGQTAVMHLDTESEMIQSQVEERYRMLDRYYRNRTQK
jgi:para-nitrobenzyl esterase